MDLLILNSKHSGENPFSLGIFMFTRPMHVRKLCSFFFYLSFIRGVSAKSSKGRKLLLLLYITQRKSIISTHIKKWWKTHCFLLHIPPQAPQVEGGTSKTQQAALVQKVNARHLNVTETPISFHRYFIP